MKTKHSNDLWELLRELVFTARGQPIPSSFEKRSNLFDNDTEICIEKVFILFHKIFCDQRYDIEWLLSKYADHAEQDRDAWG